MLDNLPPTISVTKAGEILGMSRSAAYRAASRGDLPTIRLAGRLYVPSQKLRSLLGYEVATHPAVVTHAEAS